MSQNTRLLAILFLAAQLAFPRLDPQVCGTYPQRAAVELALHHAATPQRLRRQAATRLAAVSRPAPRDIGNIAILEDADGVVERRNPFNLSNRAILFTPDAAAYSYTTEAPLYDAALATTGTPVADLGDDDARSLVLPFPFAFYGATYNRLFLNSDGNLTFGESDVSTSDRSVGRATAGPPRITGFFEDLDVTAAGEVRVTSTASLFAVSWVGVPEYSATPGAPRNTFQIVLFPDGRIVLAYETVNSRNAVIGIAPGELRGGTSIVDFTAAPAAAFPGAIVERFSNLEEIDTVFAAQKFYETHEDVYDYLVFYNTLGIPAASGAVAFEASVRSIVDGIGDILVDNGRLYGSPRRLQAVMNMGQLTQYPRDPNAFVPARATSRDTSLTVLGHEAGHLWLAFASVRDPANPAARPMLGRQTAHWGFGFNSEASLLEGNRIQDNGPGAVPRFRTIGTVEGYAPLDQYLMGLRAPDEVPPTFVVVNPPFTLPSAPQTGIGFSGERRDIAIEELIAAEGRRTPDHTVAQRNFRFAFVLITAAGQEPTTDQLSQVEGYRTAFPAFFRRASGERATAETSLLKNLQLSLAPSSGLVDGGTASASLSVQAAPPADLTVFLRTAGSVASVPASVTIRAGESRTIFPVTGLRQGVEELTAEPADATYASAFARIQVQSPAALRLTAVSGDTQTIASPGPLPRPLAFRVVDINKVPYAGQSVTASVTSGTVEPTQATTDEDGFAKFTWTPGPGPLHLLTATSGSTVLNMTAVGKPFLSTGGIVNSASFTPGIARGALVTIFGASLAPGPAEAATAVPLPRTLGGVRVLINGQSASLVYVSNLQINLVAPAGLTGDNAEVVVTWGSESVTATVPLKAVDPAIFVIDTARSGAVLIAGTGQTTQARPAAAGDVLEIYVTGLGQTTTSGTTVSIGGRQAEVLFAGATPSFPGLDQLNVRVPAGVAAGPQPLVFRIGAAVSNEVLVQLR